MKSFRVALDVAADSDLKRELYLALKEQKDLFTREAYIKLESGGSFSLDEVSSAILNFEDSLYQDLKAFRVLAFKTNLLGQIYNNQSPTLRQCPKCGLVWLKITGCSSVRCGNRSIGPDIKVGTFTNYIIEYDRVARLVKTTPTPVSGPGSYKETQFFGKQAHESPTVNPAGCGHSFRSEDAADVTEKFQDDQKNSFISDFGTDLTA